MSLSHRFGSKSLTVLGIGHETYKKVASWHYVCRVEWQDGSTSERTLVSPVHLCGSPEEIEPYSKRLTDYLDRHGTWLEKGKHMKDGRYVSWIAHKKEAEEAVQS